MYTNRRTNLALLTALTAGLLSACGSSRNADQAQPPLNQPPQVQGLTAQSIPQDTATEALAFKVSDPESSADSLKVTAVSSDPGVVPAEGIVLGGGGENRTIQLTPVPDAIGSAVITVTAQDSAGRVGQQSFGLEVKGVFVSFRDTANDMFAAVEDGEPNSLSGFTLTPDVDDDPEAFDILLEDPS